MNLLSMPTRPVGPPRAVLSTAPANTQMGTHSQNPLLRFGCRMLAYMATEPYAGQDVFLRQLLVEGENNLKRQAEKTVDEENNQGKGQYPWEVLVTNLEQSEGWGIASYDARSPSNPFVYQSPIRASADPDYDDQIGTAAEAEPRSVMVHIRQGANPIHQNNHPFTLGPWSFMHNGAIPKETLQGAATEARDYHTQYPGHPQAQGTTDTEQIFLSLMGRMRDRFQTTDPSQIKSPALLHFFRDTMGELLQKATTLDPPQFIAPIHRFERLSGLTMTQDSAIQVPVGANFILSDGDRTLILRSGRKLSLGTHRGPDGVLEAMVATQPIQPKAESGQSPVTWWEIPEQHVILLERTSAETLTVNIQPLKEPSGVVSALSIKDGT